MKIKNCPECQLEMTKCHIGPKPMLILWPTRKAPRTSIGYLLSEKVRLGSMFSAKNYPALRCEDCKIVIFEHD